MADSIVSQDQSGPQSTLMLWHHCFILSVNRCTSASSWGYIRDLGLLLMKLATLFANICSTKVLLVELDARHLTAPGGILAGDCIQTEGGGGGRWVSVSMHPPAINAHWAGVRMYEVLAKAALGWGWPDGRAKVMAPLPGLITDQCMLASKMGSGGGHLLACLLGGCCHMPMFVQDATKGGQLQVGMTVGVVVGIAIGSCVGGPIYTAAATWGAPPNVGGVPLGFLSCRGWRCG